LFGQALDFFGGNSGGGTFTGGIGGGVTGSQGGGVDSDGDGYLDIHDLYPNDPNQF
jgi:hypothetical protein